MCVYISYNHLLCLWNKYLFIHTFFFTLKVIWIPNLLIKAMRCNKMLQKSYRVNLVSGPRVALRSSYSFISWVYTSVLDVISNIYHIFLVSHMWFSMRMLAILRPGGWYSTHVNCNWHREPWEGSLHPLSQLQPFSLYQSRSWIHSHLNLWDTFFYCRFITTPESIFY